jgi:hypothetical protein
LQYLGRKVVIVPDATLTCAAKKIRLFVELDRSTKSLPRLAAGIKAYGEYLPSVYGQVYKDGLEPALVFVVRSRQRRENVDALARRQLTRPKNLYVFTEKQFVERMSVELLGDVPQPVPASMGGDKDVAPALSRWTSDLLAEIRHLDLENYFSPSFLERGRGYIAAIAKKEAA